MLVVHNAHSGQQDSLQDIKDAMQTNGLEAEYAAITSRGIRRKVAEAAKKGDTIVAAGGDGTVNFVAGLVQDTKAKLGIIPTGTLNHFAKELGIPTDLPRAIETLKAGKATAVDVAAVNGHAFINNSSIGWYPRSLYARDEVKSKVGKWPATLYGGLRAALRPRRYHVELTIDGRKHIYRTPFVFIGNNAYQRTPTGLGQRKSLQEGQLAIYVVKAQTALGIIRMLTHGLFTSKSRSQDFAIHLAPECTIRTKRRRLSVATDGEVTSLSTPLHYQSKPGSLKVIV